MGPVCHHLLTRFSTSKITPEARAILELSGSGLTSLKGSARNGSHSS